MPLVSFRTLGCVLTFTVLAHGGEQPAKQFTPQQKRFWSLQPVVQPPVPKPANSTWARNEIDAFLLAKLEEKGIQPNPEAPRLTLLRRVSLDLTGLPPSPEEIQRFLNDNSPDAYERVVDRLLASPAYGERWARHWLDLARYADSAGFKADETRPDMWRYRDYVIRSLNADKPYHRFVQEQIAGDELFPNDPDALIATGFNRHFPDESNARNLMQRRQELLNDVTDVVGSTFLGLTVGCARCHDHKFDPILQKDYYRLQAFFANTRIEDQAPLLRGDEARQWERQYAEWDAKTRAIRDEMRQLAEPSRYAMWKDNFEKYPEEIQTAILKKPEERNPFEWQMYHKSRWLLEVSEADAAKRLKGDAAKRYQTLKTELARFDSIKPVDRPVAQVMIDNSAAAPATHVLRGGAYNSPVAEVQPGFLTILDPSDAVIPKLDGIDSTGRRAALARWLTDPKNPLAARVIVNRIWHYHFGRGIAATPSDFGVMGERPTHKELLDYLASTFVSQDNWSLKTLHKRIVTTAAYRQSSLHRPEAAAADPDNKLLWRFQRRRLEGETIRDSMLFTSGVLNTQMYGPGVFPPMPPGVETRGGWRKNEDQSNTVRRSVYTFVRRNTRYPMFEAFDMPDTHESCARRSQTVTPSQSLELLNNELVLDWGRSLAARVLNDSGLSPSTEIERAWRFAYGRVPTAEERQSAIQWLDRHTPILAARLDKGEAVPLPAHLPGGYSKPRAAALVDLCHMLLNSNEFLYLD